MPRYRFTGTQELIYVDRALVVAPGDEVDWPESAPADGQWEPVDGAPDQPQDPDTAQSTQKKTSRRTGGPASGA